MTRAAAEVTDVRDAPGPALGPLRVLGLDLSLTSAGLARVGGAHVALRRARPPADLGLGHERLQWLLREVALFTDGVGLFEGRCHLAVIEGLSYGSVSASGFDRAGLFWMVRHQLWGMGVPYAIVAPKTRAKWLTGNGNAEKDECLAAAISRFPLRLFRDPDDDPPDDPRGIRGNDVADALTLAAMGAAAYWQPLVPMPKARDELLYATRVNKRTHKREPVIDWPRLEPGTGTRGALAAGRTGPSAAAPSRSLKGRAPAPA